MYNTAYVSRKGVRALKKKKKKKSKFRLRAGAGIIKGLKIVIVLYFLISYTNTFIRQEINIVRAKENIAKQTILNEEIAQKNEELKNKAEAIGTDEYIQADARNRLGMAKPGEIIIKQGTSSQNEVKTMEEIDKEKKEAEEVKENP